MPQNTLFGMGKHLNLREVTVEMKLFDRQAFFARLAVGSGSFLRYLCQ